MSTITIRNPPSASDWERTAANAQHIENLVNDATPAVLTAPGGGTRNNLARWDSTIRTRYGVLNSRGAWVTATAYAVNDLYTSGGNTYIVLTAHTSAASVATDLAAGRVGIYRGVSVADLADPATGGPALVSDVRPVARLISRGAAGNGSTSDQSVVDAALAASTRDVIFADPGLQFLVSSFANIYGREVEGGGAIVRAITGGLQQLNSYADKHKIAIGKEYLSRLYSTLNTAASVSVFAYGDSTIAGDSQSTFSLLQNLLPAQARRRGLQCVLNVTNRGVAGTNVSSLNAVPDLGTNTVLLIIKYGINDGSLTESSRLATFATTLRAKLAAIRAASNGAESQVSILLVGPNSTSDTPNGRDERWYEQLRGIYVQAARDYKCAYFDTYAFLRDSRSAATLWMDNPFGDGRAIHPTDIGHQWIWGGIFDWLFGFGETAWLRRNHFANLGSAHGVGLPATLPAAFEFGLTWQRAQAGDGWPVDGAVATLRHADGAFAMQIAWGNGTNSRPAVRCGTTSWGPWAYFGGQTAQATAASGYSQPGGTANLRVALSGNAANIEGYLTKTTAGAVAANTTLGTVPAGFAPVVDSLYGVQITAFDGTAFQTVPGRITNAGTIQTLAAISITATRVYVSAAWSLQPNV